jgi:acetyl-CoA carboxylase biotin carboxyl carrier protein
MPEVQAHITGNVWRVLVAVGDAVEEGDEVAILESMKMEMPVESDDAGTVAEVVVAEGDAIAEGAVVLVLE